MPRMSHVVLIAKLHSVMHVVWIWKSMRKLKRNGKISLNGMKKNMQSGRIDKTIKPFTTKKKWKKLKLGENPLKNDLKTLPRFAFKTRSGD